MANKVVYYHGSRMKTLP